MKSLVFAAVAAIALATPAFAAPCSTGTTKAQDPTLGQVNSKSSDVDRSSKNLAGGQQPASPGTVGAMNNAGADQKLGDQAGKGDDC